MVRFSCTVYIYIYIYIYIYMCVCVCVCVRVCVCVYVCNFYSINIVNFFEKSKNIFSELFFFTYVNSTLFGIGL